MIQNNSKDITAITAMGRVVTAVYKGARQVWSAISGLFASRFWLNDKAWNNDDFWLEN